MDVASTETEAGQAGGISEAVWVPLKESESERLSDDV